MNRVILIGRTTNHIDLKTTQSGNTTVSFTLAVNRTKKEETDFIKCVAWNKTAELISKYVEKGNMVAVEGKIQTRTYGNKQGQKVYVTEVLVDNVQFLQSRGNAEHEQANANVNTYSNQNQAHNVPQYGQSLTEQAEQARCDDTLVLDSDDLPF